MKFKSLIDNSICFYFFWLKIYIVVQVKTRFWRVYTSYVLDKKKTENNVNPLQPIVLLILKWGVRGSSSYGHVYMITFRFGHIHILITDSVSVPV